MSDLIYGDPSAPKLDVLVFGPHPDDAEIGTGGLLLKLAAQGRKTGIVDLTRGEMGSGGNVAIREQESIEAAKILKLSIRENMNLPDCGVEDILENRRAVAKLIAKYRPDVVLGTYYDLPPGRGLGHNDHIKGGLIVAHGANYAHLKKMDLGYETWHPSAVYFYFLPPEMMPSFVVDVTPYHEEWLASIYAHESQFGRPEQNPGIRDFFGAHAMRWARQARGKYAQAFYSPWPLAMDSVLSAAGVDGLQA
ncbi:MAG: PIG-L family deacetylase [bacterium]